MVENPNIYMYIYIYIFLYIHLYSIRNLCLGTFDTVAGLWRQLERTASRAGGEPSDTCIVDRIVFWGVLMYIYIYIYTHTHIYIYISISTHLHTHIYRYVYLLINLFIYMFFFYFRFHTGGWIPFGRTSMFMGFRRGFTLKWIGILASHYHIGDIHTRHTLW